ncbi:MAG: recombination-associated protein RdgC [Lautropia sp.]|nr:recombination-associated protein RdgC [Lautropia sp.]
MGAAFFRNALLFRLSDQWEPDPDVVEEKLARLAFAPGLAADAQSLGWVPAMEGDGLAHRVGRQWLLTLRAEKKLLPASVINQFTKAKAAALEEEQGFKPGRKQMRELKDRVREELLPKAFSIFRDTRVWIDPVGRWVVVDSTAPARADEIIGLLKKSLDDLPLAPLKLAHSPAQAMTAWLLDNEVPGPFSIDDDSELKDTGETRAAVRYVRQQVDADTVQRHLKEGKQCTRLALTWRDRVSFVLTEQAAVKRINMLDVVREGRESLDEGDARQVFDAEFMIMTGEMSGMLADLLAVLGGEQGGA